MTIEERATQLATHESFEGNIVHTYTDNGEKAMYIAVLKEQREIDIQRAVEWMKSNHAETLFIEGDNGEKVGNFIDEFIKAMKGEEK